MATEQTAARLQFTPRTKLSVNDAAFGSRGTMKALSTESTPLKPPAAGVAARTCSDPIFAVLFVVHLLGVGAIAAVDRFGARYARPRGHARDTIATRARLDGGDARDLRAPTLVP